MTFVLLLITIAVVVYMVGLIRRLSDRVESLEQRIEFLSWNTQKLKGDAEATAGNVSAPEKSFTEAAETLPAGYFTETRKTELPQEAITSAETFSPEPPVLAATVEEPGQPSLPPHLTQPELAKAAPAPDFNWEQFLGAKMLAWLGGLALFVGIAFFVKYSFDRDLIPPWLRVVAGFVIGSGLVIAGMKIRKKDYLVTAQTFVATGVVILYATSFIGRSLYHLINTPTLFVLMSGITVGAFALAIRMDARVVAVLGMLGGFLTPLFVGFAREQPLPLFGYVLVLNCGLLMVAKRQAWSFLIPLAAMSTVITEMLWVITTLRAENLIATLLMFGAITALFVANARFHPDSAEEQPRSLFAGTLQSLVVLGTFWFLLRSGQLVSPYILLPTLFFGNMALIALYGITLHALPLICAVSASGALLALWMHKSGSVVAGCIAALVYAALNALVPVWIARGTEETKRWPNIASVAGLGLMLMVLLGNLNPGWFFWTTLLVLNVVLLALALQRGNILLAAAGTITTAILSIYWITHLPRTDSALAPLLVIGTFAALYFFATGRFVPEAEVKNPNAVYFPAVPAGIPFFLLAILLTRLSLENPSLIFSFVLGLNALLIFVTPKKASAFPAIALIGTLLIEALWFTTGLRTTNAGTTMVWFLTFSLAFTFFPLIRCLRDSERAETMDWLPWCVSAVAGPVHFVLINSAARMTWGEIALPGLIPALLGLPAAAMLVITRRAAANADELRRFTGIFGGSLLFFITLIFPIQFDRQWLTLGWALEGLALIWLNRRAPAKWLVTLGTILLVVAFTRLAANPFIFRYYERGAIPVLNWYLYTYGIVAAALFIAATWAPRSEPVPMLRGWFSAMGTLLLFLLINIEIADIFSDGPYLAFDFSASFARDMTYSIAWSLFALALLIIGVRRDAPIIRYAGLALMGITLLKLFLHDLTRLDALFRIGAFVGVAIILIFASWLYQRFLSSARKSAGTETP